MIHKEKADQAQALLRETGIDCWLTFARESGIHFDPGCDMVVGCNITWNSAFFITQAERIAIVGRYDAANVKNIGVFNEVVTYDEGIREPLLRTLYRLNPTRIGLNFNNDDQTADGLTHGMWLVLSDLLRDTPFASRLVSAGPLLGKLRARKSPAEIERIQAAIRTTEAIVDRVSALVRPGASEADIGEAIHAEFKRRELASAWEWDSCPIVNSGPHSEAGHGKPRPDIKIEPGHLVHIDLGVVQNGYCSDLQRMWYVKRPGETGPPETIQHAFNTVIRAIEAGAAALRPGAIGHRVDQAARNIIVAAGFPEYKHALGHSLGRAVHDGGTLLGPRWERYGRTPEGIVEAGNVFTLELGVSTDAGYIGIEEDVHVTNSGCEFLSSFQRRLMSS